MFDGGVTFLNVNEASVTWWRDGPRLFHVAMLGICMHLLNVLGVLGQVWLLAGWKPSAGESFA